MTLSLDYHSNAVSLKKISTIKKCVLEKLKVLMSPFLVIKQTKLYTLLLNCLHKTSIFPVLIFEKEITTIFHIVFIHTNEIYKEVVFSLNVVLRLYFLESL